MSVWGKLGGYGFQRQHKRHYLASAVQPLGVMTVHLATSLASNENPPDVFLAGAAKLCEFLRLML